MYSHLFLTLITSAHAACTRSFLQSATQKYITAQASGQYSALSPLSSSTIYTENEIPTNPQTGILSTPLTIDHARSIHDPVLCGSFTELIVAKASHPYVIGTRMLFRENGTASLVESIVTDDGDWAFNATGYLYWDSFENWDPIPPSKRDSRAVIQAAGDAYFNRFQNASVSVPWGPLCARLEGGAYTSRTGNLTTNTCNLGLPSTIKVTNRRYIIDEEMGVVDMFLGFPGLDRSHVDLAMPDSHLFRVEGGKIKYIHTVSSCIEKGCGMNGTGPPRRRIVRRSLREKRSVPLFRLNHL